MDLRNLINDEDKASGQRKNEIQSASANAQPSTPSQHGHTSQQQTPLCAPPSAGGIARRPPQSQGMTPLRTPSQTTASAQYPFPHQTQRSPISALPGQSSRPFESQPLASSARPGSHGQPYQTLQFAPPTGQAPIQQQSSYASISPTPPSHLSRTPSSMRQSPMVTVPHLPSQQQTQYSQPNTPLGPPQHYPPRAPTHQESQSPYHQRSFSNASNGLMSGSPAQHHPGIPNLVESPSAYARPSPQTAPSRQPSAYLSQSQGTSRERSISVSPKTKPPPRPPSLGSRQSSNPQEIYSARTSEQYVNAPLAGSPSHVTSQPPRVQPQSHPQSQLGVASHPNVGSEVPQATPRSLQAAPSMIPPAAQSSLSSQYGNQAQQPQPSTTISHQNGKMGMSHLVAPASEIPPKVNGRSTSHAPSSAKPSNGGVDIFTGKERSPTPKSRTPPSNSQKTNSSGGQQMAQPNGTVSASRMDVEPKASLKRPASSWNSLEEPPSKQLKADIPRKRRERPTWARLSKYNPRFHEQGPIAEATNGHSPGPRANARPVQDGQTVSYATVSNGPEPIDNDMKRIKSILGDWERSYSNVQPLPDTKRVLADWVFTQLASLRDVGMDPQYGTVEIEGKIGTLFHKDSGERISLPVANTVILNANMSEQYRFESRMQEFEHAHMNQRLNAATKASMEERGRIKMRYKHFVDIDSFQPLSQTGLNALPASIRNRVEHGRPPRLRTTVRHEKGQEPYVAARIVKVNVGNLQIYSPNDPYDLRISINVEVNLDRPDIRPDELVGPEKEPIPDRRKDRVSYSHLAYQIDLTRVDVGGSISSKSQRPVYELELEVDTVPLRQQMEVAQQGRECAFGDIVAGFWDNAVVLMRERAPPR